MSLSVALCDAGSTDQTLSIADQYKDRLAQTPRVRQMGPVRHMIEEGFSERDMIGALLGNSRIIEKSDEDKRCLVLGA